MAAGKSFELETKLKQLEQNAKNRFDGGATDSDLSELEESLKQWYDSGKVKVKMARSILLISHWTINELGVENRKWT